MWSGRGARTGSSGFVFSINSGSVYRIRSISLPALSMLACWVGSSPGRVASSRRRFSSISACCPGFILRGSGCSSSGRLGSLAMSAPCQVKVHVTVGPICCPPSLTTTGQVPAEAFLFTVALMVVALV